MPSTAIPNTAQQPESPPVPASEPPHQASKWVQVAAAVWVALFGILLASFPARNLDLWGRLASGRAILQGKALNTFIRPAGSGWLFDAGAYLIFDNLGGGALVFAKALAVGVIGLLLLRLSRVSRNWWIAAICTAMALLAMGTRLLTQPATFSYMFLAIALGLLIPRHADEQMRPRRLITTIGLFALMLIWANFDVWFVLGLIVIGLFWAGRIVDDVKARRLARKDLLHFALTWLGLVVVCLLNPMHFRVFGWPVEVRWLAAGPSHWTERMTSPFQTSYFDTVGSTAAGLCYFPLLGLGAFSFLLNIRAWRWERVLPFLGLSLLSAVEARTLPFFAVVAGPVLAWNLQEYFTAESRLVSVLARGATAFVGLVFLLAVWPGYLQSPPYEPRHWAVETPVALQKGAATVTQWRRDGLLKAEDRGLHLSIDSARVFAWFAPDEPMVHDDRLVSAFFGKQIPRSEWLQAMRAAGVNHVYVYDRDRKRLSETLNRLLLNPKEWPILFVEGGFAVFGWRDIERGHRSDPFASLELDFDRLAFQPAPSMQAPAQPTAESSSRKWWEPFWKRAPVRGTDRDEAAFHVLHAEALRRTAAMRNLEAWDANQVAALVGAACAWIGPPALSDARMRLSLVVAEFDRSRSPLAQLTYEWQKGHALQRDDCPPALLYAGVRAGRRAVADDPNDAVAWFNLGDTYLRLLNNTRERVWWRRMPELRQLRLIQASAALNRAVALNPDLAQAHLSLAAIYGEMGYIDLTLTHQRRHAELLRAATKPSAPGYAEFVKAMTAQDQQLAQLARDVDSRQRKFAELAPKMSVYDRANTAETMGLGAQARDTLLASDISAFGSNGMALELELLLKTGRPIDVRDWTVPEQMGTLGEASYRWFRVQAFASLGDYTNADLEARLLAVANRDIENPRAALALALGQAITDLPAPGSELPNAAKRAVNWFDLRDRVSAIARYLRHEADVNTLRGLLALEQGDTAEAEAAFREALAIWRDNEAAATGAGLDFNGRIVAQSCLEWLTQAAKPRR